MSGVKLFLSHWGKNIGWGCLRIGCWGRYLDLKGKPKGKRILWRPSHRWKDHSKIDLQEVGSEMHGLDLSGSRQGQMTGSCECSNKLSSSVKCFSRRALLHGVSCVKWVGFHDVSRWTKSIPESIVYPDSTLFAWKSDQNMCLMTLHGKNTEFIIVFRKFPEVITNIWTSFCVVQNLH